MALGKRRREQQGTFWVATEKLCNALRNAFYDRLNQLLDDIKFDEKLEEAAAPYYEKTGRKGLAPGIYFRMIFIGYFEDISSQRGIAWRCADTWTRSYPSEATGLCCSESFKNSSSELYPICLIVRQCPGFSSVNTD